jgi:hypothetical protein
MPRGSRGCGFSSWPERLKLPREKVAGVEGSIGEVASVATLRDEMEELRYAEGLWSEVDLLRSLSELGIAVLMPPGMEEERALWPLIESMLPP